MTRCYGWSLKYTSLIPLADCLNHDGDSIDHYMVDIEIETGKKISEIYKKKSDKINFDILNIKGNKGWNNWRKRYL